MPTPAYIAPEPRITYPAPPERDLYALAQRLRLRSQKPIPRVVNPEPPDYPVGREDAFQIIDLDKRDAFLIQAVLQIVTPHAYWYVERGRRVNQRDLARAAEVFEEVIYPLLTGYLGREWVPGVDNDPHLTILHAHVPGVAGYFSSADEYPQAVYPLSNQREMIYINIQNLGVGSEEYLGTLAHELQHAIHWRADSTEETWVNEGLSEVARELAGYGQDSFIPVFLKEPSTQLNTWPDDTRSSPRYYGAAHLFLEYLITHYGGYQSLRDLVEEPAKGADGIESFLAKRGANKGFRDVFADWVIANYLDLPGDGIYSHTQRKVSLAPTTSLRGAGQGRGEAPQHSAQYIELLPDSQRDVMIRFQGEEEVRVIPTDPHSGQFCWWSNRGDSIDSTLTRQVDLSKVATATLEVWLWFDLEEEWDYAYAEVSRDEGVTWDILRSAHTTARNPVGNSYGYGFTGKSQGWVQDRIDLTPYAGQNILLRLEYITDEAVNNNGLCLDDIAIPEIGFLDDAETQGDWDSQGFVRMNNRLEQEYILQIIQFDSKGVASVRKLAVDHQKRAEALIENFGGDVARAVLVVAPITPITTQPAPFIYSVTAAR